MIRAPSQNLAADSLTVARILAAPVFAWCVWKADHGSGTAGIASATLFAFAVWSDIADGRWARRNSQASAYGRWLDHGADISFLTCAFGTYTLLGIVPWWVPASILVAFATYVVRSHSQARRAASFDLSNQLGHWGGVLNYALLGTLVGNFSLQLYWLPDSLVLLLFSFVPVYSTAPLWAGWLERKIARQRTLR